jgi:hypothetical protein
MCQPWPAPNAITVQEAEVMADGFTVRGTACTSDALASSIGSGYLSENYPAGPATIGANHWVTLAGGKLAPLSGTEAIYGVAPFGCAANATSCEVAVAGQVMVATEGAVAADHYLIAGSGDASLGKDSGQTVLPSLCSTVHTGGRALAAAAAGVLAPVQLLAGGAHGMQLCGRDLPLQNRTVKLGGYEVGAPNAASPLATADLTNPSFLVNDGNDKTLV